MGEEIMLNVHELRFPEKDEWTKRFNYVGQLWDKTFDETLSKEENKLWWDEWMSAKYCLEQGLPMSFILDLSLPHPSLSAKQ